MSAGRAGGGAVEWTPANVVTTVRICLIPVFLVLLLAPWASLFWDGDAAADVQAFASAAVFALIALTDSLDGYLARSRDEVTVFGKFMDPIADKVLVVAALVALVELGSLPSWVPIVVVARELLVSGLRMLVAVSGTVVAANWIGKAKTFTTMVAIVMFLLDGAPALAPAQPWFGRLSWAVMLAAVALTVVSMADYFVKSWPLVTGGGAAERPGSASDVPAACPAPAMDARSLEGRHAAAADVLAAARARGATLGTAESCTGGLVAAALTSVAGSSESVGGGVVSYMPSVKERALGVPHATIEGCGVVSAQTAAAMAQGARTALGVDYAVSTTGVAGPGGGNDENPVGTVWFGVAGPDGARTERRVFPGSRAEVRAQAVDHALALLGRALRGQE